MTGTEPLILTAIQEGIGRAIRLHRVRRDLRQYQLADAAGIAPTRLCRIERGRTMPNLAELVRLGQALGVSAADLIREGETDIAA